MVGCFRLEYENSNYDSPLVRLIEGPARWMNDVTQVIMTSRLHKLGWTPKALYVEVNEQWYVRRFFPSSFTPWL